MLRPFLLLTVLAEQLFTLYLLAAVVTLSFAHNYTILLQIF